MLESLFTYLNRQMIARLGCDARHKVMGDERSKDDGSLERCETTYWFTIEMDRDHYHGHLSHF